MVRDLISSTCTLCWPPAFGSHVGLRKCTILTRKIQFQFQVFIFHIWIWRCHCALCSIIVHFHFSLSSFCERKRKKIWKEDQESTMNENMICGRSYGKGNVECISNTVLWKQERAVKRLLGRWKMILQIWSFPFGYKCDKISMDYIKHFHFQEHFGDYFKSVVIQYLGVLHLLLLQIRILPFG